MTDSQALEPTKPKKVRERPTYDPAMVERGLLALAECNGNGRKAERLLKEDGLEIDFTTLYRWRNKLHVEQYERVQAEVMPKVRRRAVEDHMALSERYMEAEHLVLDRFVEEVPNLDKRDLSTGARNLSTSGAIHIDKAVDKLGQGDLSTPPLDVVSVLRKLGGRGMRVEATERVVTLESTDA